MAPMVAKRTGRRATIIATVLGIFVIIAFGFTARNKIIERWYIWRLRSDDEITKLNAAEKLGEMKSVASIPYLVEAIAREPKEELLVGINKSGSKNLSFLSTKHFNIENNNDLLNCTIKFMVLRSISFSLHSIAKEAHDVLINESVSDKRTRYIIKGIIMACQNSKIAVMPYSYFINDY
jgi:hypothetical protein